MSLPIGISCRQPNEAHQAPLEIFMNNQVAITFAVLIIGLFVADHFWLHMGLPVLAGKAVSHLIDFVVFWR